MEANSALREDKPTRTLVEHEGDALDSQKALS